MADDDLEKLLEDLGNNFDLDNLLKDFELTEIPKLDPFDLTRLLSLVWQRHGGKSYKLKWDGNDKIEIKVDGYVSLEIRKMSDGLELSFVATKGQANLK